MCCDLSPNPRSTNMITFFAGTAFGVFVTIIVIYLGIIKQLL
jgi:hypothetical protein